MSVFMTLQVPGPTADTISLHIDPLRGAVLLAEKSCRRVTQSADFDHFAGYCHADLVITLNNLGHFRAHITFDVVKPEPCTGHVRCQLQNGLQITMGGMLRIMPGQIGFLKH